MADGSQFALLKQRRFAPFFWTQFLGAFNDNVYKNALVILLAYQATNLTAIKPDTLVNLAAGFFILPFFLFSASSGQLADKFEKSRLIRYIKIFEVGIMLLAAYGLQQKSVALLLACLFLMGLHSTLFGPVKYAILPQQLHETELVGGNGLIEMGTFIAILLGTILGGVLIGIPGDGWKWVSLTVIAVALAGVAVAWGIPRAAAPSPDLKFNWNPFTETWRSFSFIRSNRTVFLSILGISWFWFVGSLFVSQFPNFAKNELGGNEHVVTVLLATFSIGVGIGSLLCERLSGHKVEIGLVPFGSIGLTLFGIDLYFATPAVKPEVAMGAFEFLSKPGNWRLLFDLAMIGMFGGFFIVPLFALIQTRSDPQYRSRIIAGNNILNALFMVLAAGFAILCLSNGMSINTLLLLTAILNAFVAIYIYTLVPEFLMRFLVWILVHSIYRLRVKGIENIPEQGPALLICNHVSFVDALIIAAACRRPIRFVMDHGIFKVPLLSFFFRSSKAIPIAPGREDPQVLERAYDAIAAALEQGELVGIFPEGKITYDGELNEFRGGMLRILERTPVPVVPMALQGLWGSFFSRKEGKAMSRWPRRGLLSQIGLAVGAAVTPAAVSVETMQAQVLALRGAER